tara:strand:+ start:55 stop:810 length:756 start_codon:yes stop_codon:yes gene_type:complete
LIIKFSLIRLSIIFLLVILFPLVQNQWLNLYLFNINNFTIYKVLYYLSGIIVPILVIINSLNDFTYYKFNYYKKNKKNYISGKLLLLLTAIILTLLSILISQYIFINFKIFLNFFFSNNEYLVQFDIDKQILFVIVFSTLLIIQKTKFIIKKIILANFLIFSITTWYSQINNSFFIDGIPSYIFKFGNINFINIAFLLAIETVFYVWSYISYSSNLSDWKVPIPSENDVSTIFNIVMIYLSIFLYYSILFK